MPPRFVSFAIAVLAGVSPLAAQGGETALVEVQRGMYRLAISSSAQLRAINVADAVPVEIDVGGGKVRSVAAAAFANGQGIYAAVCVERNGDYEYVGLAWNTWNDGALVLGTFERGVVFRSRRRYDALAVASHEGDTVCTMFADVEKDNGKPKLTGVVHLHVCPAPPSPGTITRLDGTELFDEVAESQRREAGVEPPRIDDLDAAE